MKSELRKHDIATSRKKKVVNSLPSSETALAMNDFTEVTAENLRFVRGSKGLNQDDVAEVLGLQKYHVSNIETGRRALSDSEKKLLDWYFFGILPARLSGPPSDVSGLLEFDETEWRIIEILANREGLPPREWIAKKIQDYLAIFKTHPPEPVAAGAPKKTVVPMITGMPSARVAEGPEAKPTPKK
jgi:transcriptional regulator with XRE-family HTH domain